MRVSLPIALIAFSTLAYADTNPVQLASIVRPPLAAADTSIYRPVMLDILLNGENVQSSAFALLAPDGAVLIAKSTVKKLGLKLPETPATKHRNEAYYSTMQFPGLSHQLRADEQTLRLKASSEILPLHKLNAHDQQLTPIAKPNGGNHNGILLNYDWQLDKRDGGSARHNLTLETGVFTAGGVAFSSFSNVGTGRPHGQNMKRLESYWLHDDPAKLMTLRLGDAYTQMNNWGFPVRLTGIQWGSNSALRPGFIPFALPQISGTALSSANAKIFVNDSYQSQMKIPTGNFQINDVPVTTGSGEIRAVIKDSMGREQVYVQPYYASPNLLRAGRHEYQINVGFERHNFGMENDAYGDPIAILDHSYGITRATTTGVRVEARHDQQAVGLSLTQLLPVGAVISATGATSRSKDANGHMTSIGLERTAPRAGFSVFHQAASKDFRQLGMDPLQPVERQRSVFRAYVSPTGGDSLQLNYNRRVYDDTPTSRFVGLSYHFGTSKELYWTIYGNRELNEAQSYAIGVSLHYILPGSRSVSANWSKSKNAPGNTTVTVQDPLPTGSGYGYRATASQFDSTTNGNITLMAQNDMQTYETSVSREGNASAYSLGVRGGLVSLGGYVLPSRHTTGSFGIAKVGDNPNVKIMHENNPVATTNSYGVAVVPNMRAYEINRIRFAENDLPINVSIQNPEMEVVPGFRSGVMVEFPVKVERHAALTFLQPDGTPVPKGALVRIDGRKESFHIYLKGETFIPDAAGDLRGNVSYDGKSCRFSVTIPSGASPMVRMAPIQCKGESK